MNQISNIVTIIRNAYLANKKIIKIPYTKLSNKFITLLLREDFFENIRYHRENKNNFIMLTLKEKKIFLNYKSHSHKKICVNNKKIPKILDGMGFIILSTSYGLMTDKEARLKKIGGEIILQVL
uniref:ribosomal protein S8 n=1 Tax=Hydnora abyssinica TaxID=470280 RepID=UPI00211442C9|nr:ribosomal protein S8 [Hydnora abyssinica]USN93594.1 ribosomal protein S8 [Hydnora abyssinica]